MNKITIYLYKKCSTCQKALAFLEKINKKHSYIIKEIVQEPPSVKELEQMLKMKNGNLKKLFNTSGMLYRELGLSEKLAKMSQKEALELLSKNGMLVKRPFLTGENIGLTGFKEVEWGERLS